MKQNPPQVPTKVRLQDIANEVGVSAVTVGKVLNNSGGKNTRVSPRTAEAIRTCARNLGYHPNLLARSLKRGRSRNIGVLCSALQNEVTSQEIVALVNELLKYGYTTQLVYDRGESALRHQACCHLAGNGCDALVISCELSAAELAELPKLSIPLFFNSHHKNLLPDQTIFMDFEAGCREALQVLEKLGHRHLLLICSQWNNVRQDQRYNTYKKFLAQRGFDGEKQLLLVENLDDLTETKLRGTLQLWPQTTAILCSNDLLALKTIQLLNQMTYQVPRDFSIIGFDDIVASSCSTPPLSSIRQPVAESAVEMVKLIRNKLENLNLKVKKEIPCRLIQRDSIAPSRH